jgi:hypothetical protein
MLLLSTTHRKKFVVFYEFLKFLLISLKTRLILRLINRSARQTKAAGQASKPAEGVLAVSVNKGLQVVKDSGP